MTNLENMILRIVNINSLFVSAFTNCKKINKFINKKVREVKKKILHIYGYWVVWGGVGWGYNIYRLCSSFQSLISSHLILITVICPSKQMYTFQIFFPYNFFCIKLVTFLWWWDLIPILVYVIPFFFFYWQVIPLMCSKSSHLQIYFEQNN